MRLFKQFQKDLNSWEFAPKYAPFQKVWIITDKIRECVVVGIEYENVLDEDFSIKYSYRLKEMVGVNKTLWLRVKESLIFTSREDLINKVVNEQ